GVNVAAEAVVTRYNLLTNPGFEVAQRGQGPFTTNGRVSLDRWPLSLAAGTMSVTQYGFAANVDVGSLYAAAIVYTHAGGVNSRLMQAIEGYPQLWGRTVTLAMRVKTSTAAAVRLSVWDSVNGFRYSAYHTGGGAHETLTGPAPVAAAATGVQVGVNFDASCTAYADNAVLVTGPTAVPYTPL